MGPYEELRTACEAAKTHYEQAAALTGPGGGCTETLKQADELITETIVPLIGRIAALAEGFPDNLNAQQAALAAMREDQRAAYGQIPGLVHAHPALTTFMRNVRTVGKQINSMEMQTSQCLEAYDTSGLEQLQSAGESLSQGRAGVQGAADAASEAAAFLHKATQETTKYERRL